MLTADYPPPPPAMCQDTADINTHVHSTPLTLLILVSNPVRYCEISKYLIELITSRIAVDRITHSLRENYITYKEEKMLDNF
jgi:hypothetical protein